MASTTPIEPSSCESPCLTLNNCSVEQVRKLFIGGLNYTTTCEQLREYCSNYGEITECAVMRDREGRSRGFAFVSFQDRSMVDYFMEHRPHTIDARKTEVKRAIPRDEASKPEGQLTVKKIFIGGMKDDVTENDLKEYFQKFGNITECHIMKDKEDRLRGFAFVTFDDYDVVDRCILAKPHIIRGKVLDVRKAIPREKISRIHNSISTKNCGYSPAYILNPPSLPPALLPPYSCVYPSKPMPLMNSPVQSSVLPCTTVFFPFRHQIYAKNLTNHGNDSARSRSNNDEQHRKLFIGGLSLKTTDETLKEYVTQVGDVTDCLVMKDQHGQSKCFGFVTFIHPKSVDAFMKQRPHFLDGRQIDPKRAMPREEATNDDIHLTVRKIFIGGIRDGLDEQTLRTYFDKFGMINDCLLMLDKDGRTRGFAFIEFDDYDSVDKVILARPHTIDDHRVDVKKAVPKDQRQQQQYALQMQAATTYYHYNPIPYHMFTQPIFSPYNGIYFDESFSHNNHHLANSSRQQYLSKIISE